MSKAMDPKVKQIKALDSQIIRKTATLSKQSAAVTATKKEIADLKAQRKAVKAKA